MPAKVTSIEALRGFLSAMYRFEDGAGNALASLFTEIHKAMDWLEHDRPAYWQGQVRQLHDEVVQTRTAYNRCRMKTVGGQRPACLEEKQALSVAKQKLQIAEEKIEIVKRWTVNVSEEVDEFRGRVGQLQHCLEGELPEAYAALEKMVASLEAYAEVHRPGEGGGGGGGGSADGKNSNQDGG